MRNLLVFVTTLTTVVIGCHKGDLDFAGLESIVQADSDSVYHVLSSSNWRDHAKDSDKAMHALLLSEAEYKQYITPTSDSARQYAYGYFSRNHKEEKHLMKACFLLGEYMETAKEYNNAILLYKEAAVLADRNREDYYAGLAYRGLGYSYRQMCCPADAIEMMRTARNRFESAGKEYHKYAITTPIAEILAQQGEYDSAETEFLKALSYFIEQGHTGAIHELYTFYNAMRLEQRRMFASVIESYDMLQKTYGIELYSYDMGVLAYAFAQKGDSAKAISLIQQCASMAKEPNEIYWASYWEFAVWKELNRPREAFEAYKKMETGSRDIITAAVSQSVAINHSNLYYSLYQESLNKLVEQEKKIHFIDYSAGIILFILLILLAASIYQRLKNKDLRQKVSDCQKDIDALSRELETTGYKTTHTGKFWLDTICRLRYDHKNEQLGSADLDYISDMQNNGKQWNKLLSDINESMGGLVDMFRKEMPEFTHEDLKLFVLKVSGLSHYSIAVLSNIDSQNAVSTRLHRLKDRITRAKPSHMVLFIDLIERD